ncbi:hypothetical protein [Streptomyces sp. TE5632]
MFFGVVAVDEVDFQFGVVAGFRCGAGGEGDEVVVGEEPSGAAADLIEGGGVVVAVFGEDGFSAVEEFVEAFGERAAVVVGVAEVEERGGELVPVVQDLLPPGGAPGGGVDGVKKSSQLASRR